MATKTQNTADATATGGLLVVLGIIVALAAAYFLFGMQTTDSASPVPSISADVPNMGEGTAGTPATGTAD